MDKNFSKHLKSSLRGTKQSFPFTTDCFTLFAMTEHKSNEKYKIHFPIFYRISQRSRNIDFRAMLPMVARKLSAHQKARIHQKIRVIHHRKCFERLVASDKYRWTGNLSKRSDRTSYKIAQYFG